MASDCTVAIDNGYINIRVGAIIMKGNKFLMVGNQKDDYLYSVGGRIKFGETAEEAIVREVYEETGSKLEIDRLGFIHENFFYGDYGKANDKLIYEISYFLKVFSLINPVHNIDNCVVTQIGIKDDHIDTLTLSITFQEIIIYNIF